MNSSVEPEDVLKKIIDEAFDRPELQGRIWDEVLGRFEHDLIRKALNESGGVRLRAAEILGIHRNTLRKKLEEMESDNH